MRILIIILFEIFLQQFSFAQKAFNQNGKFGFKLNGKEIIAPSYDYATDFSDGLACVKLNNKWGYINANNEWILKPQFDQAQPIRKGVAKVWVLNKYGLVNANGEIWVQPIYQEITELNYGYELTLNGQKGYVREGWKPVPATYISISEDKNWISAKINDVKYDIFNSEEIILDGIRHSVSTYDINAANEFIVKKDNLYGIYNINHGWVEKPIYPFICTIYAGKYEDISMDGELVTYYNHYALFESYSNETEGRNAPEELHNEKFKIINGITHKLIKDNVTGYKKIKIGYGYNAKTDYDLIGKDYKLKLSELLDFESKFMNVIIRRKNDVYYVIDGKDSTQLLEAEKVKPFQIIEHEYDEFGSVTKSIASNVALPFLIIEENSYKRIYNIQSKKFVSEHWKWNAEFSINPNYFSSSAEHIAYLIECKQKDKYGYLTSAQNNVISTKWLSTEFLEDRSGVIAKRHNDDLKIFCKIYDTTHVFAEAEEILSSNNWGRALNENDYQPSYVLTFHKMKMGVVINSHTIIPPTFDTLYRAQFSEILVTKKDNLYGIINISSGEELSPRFTTFPEIKAGENFPRFYVNNKDELIGIDGAKYPYVDAEFTTGMKGKNWGVGYYNNKDEDYETLHFTTPPVYKYVQEMGFPGRFTAQNNKGNYGIISPFGDTIIPFDYTDFGDHDLDIPWEKHLPNEVFNTSYSKNGVGLISTIRGVIIPADFDYIEVIPFYPVPSDVFFLVKNKKNYGVYSLKHGEIFSPSFTNVVCTIEEFDYESDQLFVENKKGRKGIVNTKGDTILPINYDFIENDQDYYWGDFPDDYTLRIKIGNKSGMWSHRRGLLTPARFDYVSDFLETYHRDFLFFHTKINDKEGAYNYYGKELLPCAFDEITPFAWSNNVEDTVVLSGVLDGKYYANAYCLKDSSVTQTFSWDHYYDNIIGKTGVRFNADEILTFNLLTGKQAGSSKEGTIEFEGMNFKIFVENGKYGAKDFEGKILVAPEYDSAIFMEDRADVMIGYQNGIMYYIYPTDNRRYTEEEW